MFQPQLNPSLSELVFSSSVKLQDVINTASKLRQDVKFQDVKDEFHTTCSNEAEIILYLAAKISQKELQATVDIQYSPVNPDEISQDNVEAIVRNKLFSFLHLLMTPNKNSDEISIDKEFLRTDNENFHRFVLSVGQDMVYITEGKKCTPKHVGLSMSLLHLIRSNTILTMLNRQGHCVSYDEAQGINTEWAKNQVAVGNIVIPGNIEPGYFVHAAADNFDIGSESLDGKGLHCSNIVLYQPRPDDLQGQFCSVQTLSNKERSRALKLSEEQLNEAKVMDCPNLSLKCPGPVHMIGRVATQ